LINALLTGGHAAAPSRSSSSAFITIRRTKLATGLSSRAAAASSRAFNSASIGTLSCGQRSVSRIETLSHAVRIRCEIMTVEKNYLQRTPDGVQTRQSIPISVMNPDNQIGTRRICGVPGCAGRGKGEGQVMNELVTVLRAADAAARWHVNQRRKGAAQEPYVTHLLEVAALVAEATACADPNLVVAALLHERSRIKASLAKKSPHSSTAMWQI
jgi:hypothetical protein